MNRIGYDQLAEKIVQTGICVGCGSCVVVCPFKGILEYSTGKPNVVGECKDCGICPRVCPRYAVQKEEIESFIFGRVRKPEESFGIYRQIHVAESTHDKFYQFVQDGGVATTLLSSALDSGMIDGALVSGIDPLIPWLPEPFIATTREELLRCAGTRYTYSPNLLGLASCVAEGLKKVALVGTPCQILAFRRIQMIPLKKFANIVVFTLGLFCSESFTYEGLMVSKIQNELGIELTDIEKMNIKGKMLLTLKNGEEFGISLKETKKYTETKCKYCDDFSAEFADISLGGVGLNRQTFTVVRTEQGEKIFNQAIDEKALHIKPIEDFTRAYDLLIRLSKLKRKKSLDIT